MFFNLTRWVLSFLFLFQVLGCGIQVGEKPKEIEATELGVAKCLDNSMDDLEDFFKGRVPANSRVNLAVQCLSDTVKTFIDTVNGKEKDKYTASEFLYFINKNLIKGNSNKVSDELFIEIMNLKVALLGGNTEIVTKSELSKIRSILSYLRPSLIKINPYMPIVIKKEGVFDGLSEEEKEKKFSEAQVVVDEVLSEIFSQFSKENHKYNVHSVINLIKEVMMFSDATAESVADVELYRDLAVAIKKEMIGDPDEFITQNDWRHVSKAVGSVLCLISRHYYFIKSVATPNDDSYVKVARYKGFATDIAEGVYRVLLSQNHRTMSVEQVKAVANGAFIAAELDAELDSVAVHDATFIKNALTVQPDGADLGQWTEDDFLQLSHKIGPLLVNLADVLRLFGQMKEDPSWKTDVVLFEKYEKQLPQYANNLTQLFEGGYDIRYVKSLLESIERSRLISNFEFPKDYDKYVQVAIAAKEAITGVDGSGLNPQDLKNILGLASKGYFHYLEYKHYLDIYLFEHPSFSQALDKLLPKVKSTLLESLKLNVNQFISGRSLLNVYLVYCGEFDKKPIASENSLKSLVQTLLDYVLIKPEYRLMGKKLPGVNKEALDNLFDSVQLFTRSNILIAPLFSQQAALSRNLVLFKIQDLLNKSNNTNDKFLYSQILKAVSGDVSLTHQDGLFKIFDKNQEIYQYADLHKSNLVRTIGYILIRSTSLNPEHAVKGDFIKIDDLQIVYNLLESTLLEMDVVSPLVDNFLGRRFLEANLFVSRADGDDMASLMEIHDIVLHIMSGTSRAKSLRDNVVQDCISPNQLPFNRFTEVKLACLLDVIYRYNDGFEYLPEYISLKSNPDAKKVKEYYLSLLKAAGYVPNDKNIIIVDDMDNYAHIVQYIEMMYARFDIDRNRELTKNEALMAFPVFRNLIADVISKIDGGDKIKEDQYPGVFIYFLKNGKAPETALEKIGFLTFISNEKKWESLHATRYDVGKVFNYIAESTTP